MNMRYQRKPGCTVAQVLLLVLLAGWATYGAQAQDPVIDRQSEDIHVDLESGHDSENQDAVSKSVPSELLVNRVGKLVRRASASGGYGRDIDNPVYNVDIRPYFWYNRVDGAHFGLDRMVESSRYFKVGGGVGWNSALSGRDRWTWHATARLKSTGRTAVFVKGQYLARTARRYGETSYVSAVSNGLVMMLGGDDYFDYYRSEGYSGTAGVEFSAIKTRLSGTFRSEDHTALPLSTSYDLFNVSPLRGNPAIAPGRLQTVSANLEIGAVRSGRAVTGNRSLTLGAEASIAGSDYAFRRYWVDARWKQAIFCGQCKNSGSLSLRLTAGTSTGSLPLQRAFIVDNAIVVFSTFGALRSVTGPPFEGDKMVAFFWEYDLGEMGLRALGLRTLARSGLSLIAFGGHTGTWAAGPSNELAASMQMRRVMEGAYHELGLSLRGVFGGMRVDFAKPLDGGAIAVGVGIEHTF